MTTHWLYSCNGDMRRLVTNSLEYKALQRDFIFQCFIEAMHSEQLINEWNGFYYDYALVYTHPSNTSMEFYPCEREITVGDIIPIMSECLRYYRDMGKGITVGYSNVDCEWIVGIVEL